MRILNLASDFSTSLDSGLSPSTYYIAKEQLRQGNDVSIFALTRGAEREQEMEGVKIRFVKKPHFVRWLAGISFLKKARMLGEKPDIVHSINTIPLGWLFPIAKKNLETKYCLSVHSSIEAIKKGGVHGLSGFLDSFEYAKLCVFLARRVDLVLPAARFVARELEGKGIDAAKIRTIPTGVDFELFSKKTGAKKTSEFTLLYAGRFAKTKGVVFLLEALKLLEKKRVKLLLCGARQSDNDYKNVMKKISMLGLNESVKIIPPTPHALMPQIYHSADAFVLPSLLDQNPKAVNEAMAAGLPVIATRQGGLPETIKSMENGLLVMPGNAAAIANAIETIMDDSTLRKKIAANGIETAKALDWKIIARQYTKAFKECTERIE